MQNGRLSLQMGDRVFRVDDLGNGHCRVNGFDLLVSLKTEIEHRFSKYSSETKIGDKKLTVPMPGIIINLLVSQGDQVKKGQGLVIIEAMKMENELKSPRDAVVTSIHVTRGDSVDKGTLLMELE